MVAVETNRIGLHVGAFTLQDVSLSIPKGAITSIVGPNGSGKSTLLKTISRLLQPDRGELLIDGQPAGAYSSLQFARTLTMLPQAKQGTMPDLTVRELVAYGRSPYKRTFDRLTSEDADTIDWALEATGTKKHGERLFQTLSGGEQQKARIAMALAQRTNIVLLDEPTTYLDIAHQLDVMNMLQTINRELGITVLMVLHDIQQAAVYSHHLIAMKRGKVVVTGYPKAALTADFFKEVYGIEAKVSYDGDYPIVIPLKPLKQE